MKNFIASLDGKEISFGVQTLESSLIKVVRDQQEWLLDVSMMGPGHYSVLISNRSHDIRFFQDGNKWQAFVDGDKICFDLKDEKMLRRGNAAARFDATCGDVIAPMPGKVVQVKVRTGQNVKAGEGLLVVEAMKMQNEFKAALAGMVQDIKVKPGDAVEKGEVMIHIIAELGENQA